MLVDLAQKFSQLCVTVIIGFAALSFAIAAFEFNKENEDLKVSLHSLIEWLVYYSTVNLALFLASYLSKELIESWIIVCFLLSLFTFLIVFWKFFKQIQYLLKPLDQEK